MKAVMLALMGTLIGGGVGTGGGALLLARCESAETEQHAADESESETESETGAEEVADEAVLDEAGPDTVGALGPLPDRGREEAAGGEAPAGEPAPIGDEAPIAGEPNEELGEEASDAVTNDAPPPGAVDPAAPAVEPIVLAPTPDPTALRRLARIFSNMKAEQAAAVMVELTDAEAQRILVSMSERAAAAILGKMDSSRAAVLSQLVLGGGGGDS